MSNSADLSNKIDENSLSLIVKDNKENDKDKQNINIIERENKFELKSINDLSFDNNILKLINNRINYELFFKIINTKEIYYYVEHVCLNRRDNSQSTEVYFLYFYNNLYEKLKHLKLSNILLIINYNFINKNKDLENYLLYSSSKSSNSKNNDVNLLSCLYNSNNIISYNTLKNWLKRINNNLFEFKKKREKNSVKKEKELEMNCLKELEAQNKTNNIPSSSTNSSSSTTSNTSSNLYNTSSKTTSTSSTSTKENKSKQIYIVTVDSINDNDVEDTIPSNYISVSSSNSNSPSLSPSSSLLKKKKKMNNTNKLSTSSSSSTASPVTVPSDKTDGLMLLYYNLLNSNSLSTSSSSTQSLSGISNSSISTPSLSPSLTSPPSNFINFNPLLAYNPMPPSSFLSSTYSPQSPFISTIPSYTLPPSSVSTLSNTNYLSLLSNLLNYNNCIPNELSATFLSNLLTSSSPIMNPISSCNSIPSLNTLDINESLKRKYVESLSASSFMQDIQQLNEKKFKKNE